MRIGLQLDRRTRDLALFNLTIHSKLRGCDLMGPRVHGVVQDSQVAARAIVMQKTQRPVESEMTEQTRDAVAACLSTGHSKPQQYISVALCSALNGGREEGAAKLGVQVVVQRARNAGEIDAAFIEIARTRVDAMIVGD